MHVFGLKSNDVVYENMLKQLVRYLCTILMIVYVCCWYPKTIIIFEHTLFALQLLNVGHSTIHLDYEE